MKILEQILKDKQNRKALIKEFQELVWNNENASEILSELAYDLDFYEPNDEWQKESSSYYGDDKLEEELINVLHKLKSNNLLD